MRSPFGWRFVAAVMAGLVVSQLASCSPSHTDVTLPSRTSTIASRAGGLDAADVVPKRAWFQDVAAEAGVTFIPRNGHEAGHMAILESLGVGVGLLDYDQDGMLDLFVAGGGEYSAAPEPVGLPSGLFRNRGELRFEPVATAAGVARCSFYSHGVCVGDCDEDGFPDVLITGYRGLLLYRNQGDGTFVDETVSSGLSLQSWSTSAAWGDANGDGTLDLYVTNYVDWSFEKHPACIVQGHRDICAPREFAPLSDVFYFGNGDGTFRNATAEAGLVGGGKGLGVVAADMDLDGDLDYAVANDTTPNLLYLNDGQGHFTESGLLSGTAFGETGEADGSMGIDVGDFNRDGLPDLWVANFENQSFALYRNEGDCRFQHVSAITGITAVGAEFVGFGTTFLDFDLDGDEDLFAANGHVMNRPSNGNLHQKPLLFENRDGTRFVNVAAQAGEYMSTPHLGRGVASGDLDGDGDPDLVIAHTNEPLAILRNDSATSSCGLKVRLIGTDSHRDAVGTRVTIKAHRGDPGSTSPTGRPLVFSKQIKGGASYLSSSAPELLFGRVDSDTIEAVEIVWLSGRTQRFEVKTGVRFVTIREQVQ